MNIGTALKISADVIKLLAGMGLIDTEGNFHAPKDASGDQVLAQRVEEILRNYGVTIPEKVDVVITMIPLIFALAK